MRRRKKKTAEVAAAPSRRLVRYPTWPAKLVRRSRILINPGQKGRNGRK